MAFVGLSVCSTSKPLIMASPPNSAPATHLCPFSLASSTTMFGSVNRLRGTRRLSNQVVCMAPDEEKLTRRNPLDFPIEWERPKPGRRPDIFPQFSPMKTPIPPPLPYDPPEEDEEEEEEKKKEEEEEDPGKEEDPDKPDKQ
ncbi:hypothetical protein K2173_004252 [Erythroxylum novogranatense]|uniref:Uncharacterized protein n=1 Tax=Erythroxylum novogranatense TaxID=1862640 RepID=A0AAV8TRA0_9ROSI|nr:hypothetical protein K2173_004252 [Erythroxylum novogranatense]